MFNHLFLRISLRTKIIGLALVPALICSIVYGALIWNTSRSTAKLVGAELTRFITERVSRGTIHGYNTSVVTYGYLLDALDANAQTIRITLEKQGGIHAAAGPLETWQAVNELTHESRLIETSALAIGSWHAATQSGPGPLLGLTSVTGRAVVLYQRIDSAGDLMRVAESSPTLATRSNLGSYIPARLPDSSPNPVNSAILANSTYRGRVAEFATWYTDVCDPVRNGNDVIGMLCVGIDDGSIRSLKEELAANFVGAHGSVAAFFVHGPDRGRLLIEPTGIAHTTEQQWLPVILDKSLQTKDKEVDGTTVHDAASGADVVVRFCYFEKFDWAIAVIADSRDLQAASLSVDSGFQDLLWRSFLAGLVALALAVLLALQLSNRIIDPMADLTIRLTSNATQIASSAQQQAANVANLNTSGNQIAAAVKEISATSKELLRSMEQLAEDAEMTSTAATQGSLGLKGLGSSIESLSLATHSITDKLTAIRAKANKINSVVTAITKVADQTNLLSLNAAIEAEKAGEAGAGFAVVAREIRRLADQSALASLEIEQMVEAMQDAVSSGVAETRDLSDAMERGIQASQAISGQFSDIIRRVESMAPRYEAVHEGMQHQSEGAAQISDAMLQLTDMGRQTSESVNDLDNVSHQLHDAVRILKERIIHIREGK